MPDLPTTKQVLKLPRRARVAFAARCARRVIPLLQKCVGEPHIEPCKAIKSAINEAEAVAMFKEIEWLGWDLAKQKLLEWRGVLEDRSCFDVPYWTVNSASTYGFVRLKRRYVEAPPKLVRLLRLPRIAKALHIPFYADAEQERCFAVEADYMCAEAAAKAASASCQLTEHAIDAQAVLAVEKAICLDFRVLRRHARRGRWNHETPVPVDFSSLWPDGVPASWPEETETWPVLPRTKRDVEVAPQDLSDVGKPGPHFNVPQKPKAASSEFKPSEDTMTEAEALEQLRATDPSLRRDAALKLKKWTSTATQQALLQALQDSDEFVVVNAARSLAHVGERDAVGPLRSAMSDCEPDMACHFQEALDMIVNRVGINALEDD